MVIYTDLEKILDKVDSRIGDEFKNKLGKLVYTNVDDRTKIGTLIGLGDTNKYILEYTGNNNYKDWCIISTSFPLFLIS